jgi:hypothetical protein
MDDFVPRPAATITDASRPVATTPDSDFTLSIDEALQLYAEAGLSRTPRSVQRYCAKGHLEGRLIETSFGEKWLVTPASVAKHIAYIKEVTPTTGRDTSRQVAARDEMKGSESIERQGPPTGADTPRLVATTPDTDKSQFVALLERENIFLREQVGVKDKQIAELSELYRGTHVLTQGLQRLLAPLIGAADRPKREPSTGGATGTAHDNSERP